MAACIDRRHVLKTGAALSAAGALTTPALVRAQGGPVELVMAFWGGKAEQDAFAAAITKYKDVKPNVSVRVEVVPFGQFYQQLDTRLAGKQAPDIVRLQYQMVARYAKDKGVLDLSQSLEPNYGAAFVPQLWNAVNYEGKPFALPHHTDTYALFYNVDMFKKIGVTAPTSLDKSWTWAEFIDVAKKLKAGAGVTYPFAMAWQNSVAYRWMIYLHQNGGQLLSNDLKSSMINSKAGIETLAWTQSWFKDGLVPPNTSVKNTEPTQNLFANGTIGMLLNGDWQIPFISQQAKFEWGVTYMPRNTAMASDFGGNALAVTRDTKNRDAAIDFLKFMAAEEAMKTFVSAAQFLPVRSSLNVPGALNYALRPDAMQVFVEQAKTIPEQLVKTVLLPTWSRINLKLADELDLAFTAGQAADVTAKNIEGHLASILAG